MPGGGADAAGGAAAGLQPRAAATPPGPAPLQPLSPGAPPAVAPISCYLNFPPLCFCIIVTCPQNITEVEGWINLYSHSEQAFSHTTQSS